MSLEERQQAIYDYTVESLLALREAGVQVDMVQIGNEVTKGFCGETSVPRRYALMASAAQAVRDTDGDIQIVVHYTNPETEKFSTIAATLEVYGVDYDIFATSYYPYWHGSLENLTRQLQSVVERSGKRVMVAETSYAYTVQDTDGHGNSIGDQPTYDKPYPFTVQGQSRELRDVIAAVASLGDSAVGVFYWEPGWICVPADSWESRSEKWERYGSGWASSYAAEYDPTDAGVYYGGSACDNQALFDADGHPLESLKTFCLVRTGTEQLTLYAIADGVRYEQPFAVDGWVNWQNPIIENIPCTAGLYQSGAFSPIGQRIFRRFTKNLHSASSQFYKPGIYCSLQRRIVKECERSE